jgi:ABC-type multidrug transport system ATPase subunit
MEEADQLCRRVAFLEQGRIAALDTPGQLKRTHGRRCLTVTLDDGQTATLSLDDPADGRRLGELAAVGRIVTAHSAEATLEEVFIELTGRRLHE